MHMMGSGAQRQRLSRRMTRDEITRVARRQEHALRDIQAEVKQKQSDLLKAQQALAKEHNTGLWDRFKTKLRSKFGFKAQHKG